MTIETGLIEEKEILLTQKGEIRKRKPKQSILYFTQETEDAIIQYLITEDEVERNRIYNEKIDKVNYRPILINWNKLEIK